MVAGLADAFGAPRPFVSDTLVSPCRHRVVERAEGREECIEGAGEWHPGIPGGWDGRDKRPLCLVYQAGCDRERATGCLGKWIGSALSEHELGTLSELVTPARRLYPAAMTDDLLELAVTASRAAGVLLRERFRAPRTGVDTKSSLTDMVTDADRAAEALIKEGIHSERPDDAILGEETGEARGSSGLRWVVDPLDGTTNFLFGIPHWAVSIACEDADGAFVGVVYDPLRDELFSATRGDGAMLNGSPIEVSDTADVSRALVGTGFSYLAEERAAAAALLPTILPRVRDVRRAGAASLDFAWVGAGRLDGFYESGLAPWDAAAGTLIVREAGGRIDVMPALGPNGTGFIAAGPRIFDDLRDLIDRALGQSTGESHGARIAR